MEHPGRWHRAKQLREREARKAAADAAEKVAACGE
jgi:hypothetical protein